MLAAIWFHGASASRNDKTTVTYGTNYDNVFGKVRKTTLTDFGGQGVGSPAKGSGSTSKNYDASQGLAAGNMLNMMNGRVEAIFGVNIQELGRQGFKVTQTSTTTNMELVTRDGRRYMKTTVRNDRGEVVSTKEELLGGTTDAPAKNNPNDYTRKPIFEDYKPKVIPELTGLYSTPYSDPKKDAKTLQTGTANIGVYAKPVEKKTTEEVKPALYANTYGKPYDLPVDKKVGGYSPFGDIPTYKGTGSDPKTNGGLAKETTNTGYNYGGTKTNVMPETKYTAPQHNYGQPLKEVPKQEVKKTDPVITTNNPGSFVPNLGNLDLDKIRANMGLLKPSANKGDNSSPKLSPKKEEPKVTSTKEELKVPLAKIPNTAEVLNNQGQGTKKPPTRPIGGTKKPPTLPEREKKTNTGSEAIPAGFYTKTRNTKPGYVPLNVKWELGPVKQYCAEHHMMEYYPLLKKLLHKAAAVLRMYIHVPESVERKVEVEAKMYCGDFYFPETRIYDAHVVMFGRIFYPDSDNQNTIASSKFCTKDSQDHNRAVTGSINFSSTKMVKESDSPTQKWDYVFTIVHEVLHTLAFHSDAQRVLGRDIAPEHRLLTLIKKIEGIKSVKEIKEPREVKPSIYDNGHWAEDKIVNDLMGPISRIGSIWSSITAELISHTSPDFLANNKDLVFNNFLESVSDVESFFKYQCSDQKPSPYPFMCSQLDKANRRHSCSVDYQYMMHCASDKATNNCYKVVPYSNGSCKEPRKGERGSVFEFHGPNARCFEVDNENGSMCLQYEVQGSNVVVVLGKSKAVCTPRDAGKRKSTTEEISRQETAEGTLVRSQSITIVCPDVEKFIKFAQRTSCPEDCNQNGFCSNGKCICLDGYDAADNCKKDTEIALNENMFSEYSKITVANKNPK